MKWTLTKRISPLRKIAIIITSHTPHLEHYLDPDNNRISLYRYTALVNNKSFSRTLANIILTRMIPTIYPCIKRIHSIHIHSQYSYIISIIVHYLSFLLTQAFSFISLYWNVLLTGVAWLPLPQLQGVIIVMLTARRLSLSIHTTSIHIYSSVLECIVNWSGMVAPPPPRLKKWLISLQREGCLVHSCNYHLPSSPEGVLRL